MNNDELMQPFFSGARLYGDDLSLAEIDQWYADEGEGYANLGAGERDRYSYVYHALNRVHGYAGLGLQAPLEVLGIGSAYGEELQPVLEVARHITIVDPSDAFVREHIGPVPCRYVKPMMSGHLPFAVCRRAIRSSDRVGCASSCAECLGGGQGNFPSHAAGRYPALARARSVDGRLAVSSGGPYEA